MISNILGYIVSIVLSLAAAFFGVFLILFTDVLSLQQRLLSFAYVAVLYFLWTLMLTASWPSLSRPVLWMLAIPALAAILFASITDTAMIAVAGISSVCVALGMWLGHRLAHRRLQKNIAAPLSNKVTKKA